MLKIKKPLLTPKPIMHRNYVAAKSTFGSLCRSPLIDKSVVLIGPTQAGKSLILAQCYHQALADFSDRGKKLRPAIGFKAETSKDGRVSQRFILLQALKELNHPVYEHIGDLDELEHYVPQRGRDETSMRIAADRALNSRETEQTYLDESHHLTHTTDEYLQDRIFQSIKTRFALDRALFMAGGYELAYNGLFNSPHFSGRLVVVELKPYTEGKEDVVAYAGALAQWEEQLPMKKKGILLRNAIPLLRAHNGIIGPTELHLFQCKVHSQTTGKKIDEDMLYAFMPTEAARDVIATDIAMGQEALKRCGKDGAIAKAKETPPAEKTEAPSSTNKKPRKRKPFSRAPKRRPSGMDHINVGDRDRK